MSLSRIAFFSQVDYFRLAAAQTDSRRIGRRTLRRYNVFMPVLREAPLYSRVEEVVVRQNSTRSCNHRLPKLENQNPT